MRSNNLLTMLGEKLFDRRVVSFFTPTSSLSSVGFNFCNLSYPSKEIFEPLLRL